MTKLELSVQKLVLIVIKGVDLPKKFSGVGVDIYPTDYGLECHITFLMDDTFSGDESETMFNLRHTVSKFIKSHLSDKFKSGISISVSTVDAYDSHKPWYDAKKKKNV
jgi:hypothetical protein